jgi:hypothetical protein
VTDELAEHEHREIVGRATVSAFTPVFDGSAYVMPWVGTPMSEKRQ